MEQRPSVERRFTAVGAVLILLLATGAQAASEVSNVYPLVPLRAGATAVDLGFAIEGPALQLRVSVQATTAAGATLGGLSDVVVDRDVAGAVPFHLRVPLQEALPADARVQVEATPLGEEGASTTSQQFALDAPAPVFPAAPVRVRTSQDLSSIIVEVTAAGTLASAELTLVGASVEALRRVHGSLSDAESVAFASVRRLVARPRRASDGRIQFVVPLLNGVTLPADGVVVADVAVHDAYGRVAHTSAVEFTNGRAFDPLVGLSVSPSPLLMADGYGSTARVQTTGHFALAGDVDLSGPRQGVSYASSDPTIFSVSSEGVIQARADGTAQLTVTFAGASTSSDVIVEAGAALVGLEIAPMVGEVPRVGASTQLKLEGVLADGRRVDLSSGALGTAWASLDPSLASVDRNGRVKGLRPGVVHISATHNGSTVQAQVQVIDGPPTVRLAAPSSVIAGQSFELQALAEDDVAMSHVEFLVNGVPAGRDAEPPYALRIQAPPYGGAVLKLSAAAIDLAGHRVVGPQVDVRVVGEPAPSNRKVVWDRPEAGSMLVQGLPQVLAVTSGDWKSGTLSTQDFQVARFFVDDAPAGTVSVPRIEMRTLKTATSEKQIPVPLWELTFVPRPGSAGSSLAVRVEALDKNGAPTRSETLLMRVVADSPPLLTLHRPRGTAADATAEVPLIFSGTVGDDALAFGTQVVLTVDGSTVASTRIAKGGLGGTPMGSESFSLSWTPPRTDVGRMRRVEVRATDSSGQVRDVKIDVTVKANGPPQIAILTPVTAASIPGGSHVQLTAVVSDDAPGPYEVRWTVNGAPVGVSTVPPYRTSYVLAPVETQTPLVVVAEARDANDLTARAQVELFAVPDAHAPSASIVVPRAQAKVPETEELLVSAAGLDDVDVTRVEIVLDGQVVFTDEAPGENNGVRGSFLTHTLLTPAQLMTREVHTLGVRAYDASGNVGFAPEVQFTAVEDAPPTVAFHPSTPASVTIGTRLEVEVIADDDVGVGVVELRLDGKLVGQDSLAPYRFSVTAPGPERVAVLEARASDGVRTTTVTRTIELQPDSRAPLLTFRTPAPGAPVFAGRTLRVEVAASDDVGVKQAELFGEASFGAKSNGTTEGLFQVYTWDVPVPAALAGKSLPLRAVVRDAAGHTAERFLEVPVVADEPPVVGLTAPALGTPYKEGEDVRLAFTVSDDEGVVGLVGLAGGERQGSLAESGPRIPVAGQQFLTVWAPVVSKGAPPTVGVEARDTAGQTGKAEVTLTIRPDTEPPSALLAAPLPPREGVMTVREGGSLGVRVDVGDDVRVARVLVEVDGEALSRVDGKPVLEARDERSEETRTPNPLAPGEVLTSRRYLGTFAGVVSVEGLSPGRRILRARAVDPAGNATLTSEFAFDIVAVQDTEPPRVSLHFDGTPSERTCVAGSDLRLRLSASDDGRITQVMARADGVELDVPSFPPGATYSRSWSVQMPALDAFGPRTYTFTAQVTDSVGRSTHASVSCELVADVPPVITWRSPAAGAFVLEEATQALHFDVEDDTGLSEGWLFATTRPLARNASGGGYTMAVPSGATGGYGSLVRLEYGADQAFELRAEGGVLRVTAPSTGVLGEQPRRLMLRSAPEVAAGLRAEVRYRFTLAPGLEESPGALAFLAENPGGRRIAERLLGRSRCSSSASRSARSTAVARSRRAARTRRCTPTVRCSWACRPPSRSSSA